MRSGHIPIVPVEPDLHVFGFYGPMRGIPLSCVVGFRANPTSSTPMPSPLEAILAGLGVGGARPRRQTYAGVTLLAYSFPARLVLLNIVAVEDNASSGIRMVEAIQTVEDIYQLVWAAVVNKQPMRDLQGTLAVILSS